MDRLDVFLEDAAVIATFVLVIGCVAGAVAGLLGWW